MNDENPFVAWAGFDYSYMVAYTWPASDGEKFPVYSVVHSTYQTSGNQYFFSTTYAVDPADFSDVHDKFSTGIAFDFCSKKYIIIFSHDWAGDGSDFDIYGVNLGGSNHIGYQYFPIAISPAQEISADIVFISYSIPNIANNVLSKLIAAYIREGYSGDNGIMAVEINGNCSVSSPEYWVSKSWTLPSSCSSTCLIEL